MVLRVIRRIPLDQITTSIIGHVQRKDVRALQYSLQEKRGSVYDVHGKNGQPLLHGAILQHNIDIVKILVSAGADAFQQDDYGQPAYKEAIRQIYAAPHLPIEYRRELAQVLPIGRALEETDLPVLHKIVMRILHVDGKLYLANDNLIHFRRRK